MPDLNPTHAPLAQLAIEHPGASRVFQKLRLDFCCQGRRSLAEACDERGLDPEVVLSDILSASVSGASLAQLNTPALVERIVNEIHVRVRNELPQLIALAEKVERVHAEREHCPHGLHALLERVSDELLSHMVKEERVLFPMMLAGYSNVQGPIHVMEAEHRDHAANLERIRELTNDFSPPAGACTTWRALYLRLAEFEAELLEHVHLENHVLFPRAAGA